MASLASAFPILLRDLGDRKSRLMSGSANR